MFRFMEDSLALSLYRRDFEEKTLRMLKLVRAALIYLVCTVRVEELRRKREHGSKPIGQVGMDVWEDDWKQWTWAHCIFDKR